MNEKLQYASMLEMPLSTANVTVKPQKKRKARTKTVNSDSVKNQLISKVNQEVEQDLDFFVDNNSTETEFIELACTEQDCFEQNEFSLSESSITHSSIKPKKKLSFKFSLLGVQLVIIGVLLSVIFLTSALNSNSGINVFFKNVFGTNQGAVADAREYDDFSPVFSFEDSEYMLEDGVVTLYGKGSVYSSCDGKISSIVKAENGKFTIEVEHSKNFKTVFAGLDYVYGSVGDVVYSNIPVGYWINEAQMCFTNADGGVISNYQIIDNSVVWAV